MINRKLYVVDLDKGQRAVGEFEHVVNARQKLKAGLGIARHRHTDAYATIVLSGGLQECGCRGRFDLGPGDVLLHNPYDSHLNRVFVVGAEVLNLRLNASIEHFFGRIPDADLIARTAESDPVAAVETLCRQLTPMNVVLQDWQDLLAADLIEDPNRKLEDWAEEHGLAIATVSRGFGRVFGTTPALFRAEVKARRAYERIAQGTELLSKVLEVSGFAHEDYMARAIKSLTGASPKSWVRRALHVSS